MIVLSSSFVETQHEIKYHLPLWPFDALKTVSYVVSSFKKNPYIKSMEMIVVLNDFDCVLVLQRYL